MKQFKNASDIFVFDNGYWIYRSDYCFFRLFLYAEFQRYFSCNYRVINVSSPEHKRLVYYPFVSAVYRCCSRSVVIFSVG